MALSGEHIVEFRDLKEVARQALEQACSTHLEGKPYDVKYQSQWSDSITQTAVDSLRRLSPNFKYVISCLLLQKRENNVHVESVAHWNVQTDGCCSIQWENRSILCVLHAFASAI